MVIAVNNDNRVCVIKMKVGIKIENFDLGFRFPYQNMMQLSVCFENEMTRRQFSWKLLYCSIFG